MYEQLQDFLNECIELGWKPRGDPRVTILSSSGNTITMQRMDGEFTLPPQLISFHNLFSKDSGIMEFVEWVEDLRGERYGGELAGIIIKAGGGVDMINSSMLDYHYMIMGPMTAEEKIQYFLSNAKLPQQSDK